MSRSSAAIGLCVLCAIGVGVVGVQTAFGATNGTTGFTCKEKKEPGGAGFSKAHCKAEDAVGSGAKFEHLAIAEGETTEGRLTSVNTAGVLEEAILMSTQAGISEEFRATSVHGEASGRNSKTAAGEHFIEGTGQTTFAGVKVTKPAGKGCKVKGGEITTNELKGTSLGQGDGGLLQPASGGVFAEFEIEGCGGSEAIKTLNGLYRVEGSIKASGDGATATYTEAGTTAQGTLKLRGQKAGIQVGTTVTGRKDSTEPFTPLAATTVETP